MNPSAPASSLPLPGQRLPAPQRDRAMTAAFWLAAGTWLVWVVDPKRELVEIQEPDATPWRLAGSDVLDGEPLFPGFRLPVTDIFGLTP